MKGTTILLLAAATFVAYASALPYSKIPDALNYKKSSSNSNSNSYSQSNQNDADISGAYGGQTFSGSKSSGYSTSGGSHSQSSSFSSGTFNGNLPTGLIGGIGLGGVAQNPVSYTQENLSFGNPGTAGLGLGDNGSGAALESGSSGSSYGNEAALEGHSAGPDQQVVGVQQSYGSSGDYGNVGSGSSGIGSNVALGQAGGNSASDNGASSSYGLAGKPHGGCNSNGCSLSGDFDLTKGSGGAYASNNHGAQVGINIDRGNPFINQGQDGSGYISSGSSIGQSVGSGFNQGVSSGSGVAIAASRNPFLSGGYASSNAGSTSVASAASIASSSAGSTATGSYVSSSSLGAFTGAGNPFLQPGSEPDKKIHGSGQVPIPTTGYNVPQGFGINKVPVSSGNPFLQPGSGSAVLIPSITQFPTQTIGQFPPQSTGQFPAQSTGQFPDQSTGQFPAQSTGQFPDQSTGQFPAQSTGQFPAQSTGQFPDQSTGQFPSQSNTPGGTFTPQQPSPGNPFFKPSSESKFNTGNTGSIGSSGSANHDGFTVSCSGQGKICVVKDLCVNGIVKKSGQEYQQVGTGIQECKVGLEVCCTLGGSSGSNYQADHSGYGSASSNANSEASGQASSGSYGSVILTSPTSSIKGRDTNVKQSGNTNDGGLFGSSINDSGEDLNAGDSVYAGSSGPSGPETGSASNGYLPPYGSQPSSNVPAFSKPPEEDKTPGSSGVVTSVDLPPPPPPRQPFVPAPVTIQVGCAAALLCVEEQYCTLEGVISPVPVGLTSQQIERRAPLSTCRNPENGIVGKCCRDPNYVDPWPTGNLPANYSGGFDEQGFPTYLNIGKTKPPKKQIPPTKGGIRQPSQVDTKLDTKNVAGPKQFEIFSSLFNGQFPFPGSGQTQTQTGGATDESSPGVSQVGADPQADEDQTNENKPDGGTPPGLGFFPWQLPEFNFPQPGLPQLGLPDFSNLGFVPMLPGASKPENEKSRYDSSATNENPTLIATHKPGTQCGLRNKVQRPSGLGRDDVAFGEITWQAMILSTKDRKLLCSGAIVAPNAVLTAAHCVAGFKPEDVSIKSGEWKLGYELKHEEPLPFEIVEVAYIASHPGYYSDSPSHDLAILFLQHPLALDQHVDVICLSDIPQPKPGRNCIATGWGKIVLQSNVAGSLMHSINVDLLPQDVCRRRLAGAESQIAIDDTLTCVKAQQQRNNLCQVDVGGPLACDRGDGHYELTGVYSQDTGCIPTNQVATFALIDVDWVKSQLASPPHLQLPSRNLEAEIPREESSNVQLHYENQVKQPAQTCDCQKSNLPAANNQYLPPL
ncbi:hornerin isoform X1 [Athalia rosae]|uniref:hornerin isoform X1 n=1 Tax=Athalia rosae TaxID=37344 RepID=UPI002033EA34|nr:hornerin isoform X1 [Athalia rosae]